MVKNNPHPPVQGKRLRIKYMTQVSSKPPTFTAFANRAVWVSEDYKRMLINKLRDEFGLAGVPLRLEVRGGRNPFVGREKGRVVSESEAIEGNEEGLEYNEASDSEYGNEKDQDTREEVDKQVEQQTLPLPKLALISNRHPVTITRTKPNSSTIIRTNSSTFTAQHTQSKRTKSKTWAENRAEQQRRQMLHKQIAKKKSTKQESKFKIIKGKLKHETHLKLVRYEQKRQKKLWHHQKCNF